MISERIARAVREMCTDLHRDAVFGVTVRGGPAEGTRASGLRRDRVTTPIGMAGRVQGFFLFRVNPLMGLAPYYLAGKGVDKNSAADYPWVSTVDVTPHTVRRGEGHEATREQ